MTAAPTRRAIPRAANPNAPDLQNPTQAQRRAILGAAVGALIEAMTSASRQGWRAATTSAPLTLYAAPTYHAPVGVTRWQDLEADATPALAVEVRARVRIRPHDTMWEARAEVRDERGQPWLVAAGTGATPGAAVAAAVADAAALNPTRPLAPLATFDRGDEVLDCDIPPQR